MSTIHAQEHGAVGAIWEVALPGELWFDKPIDKLVLCQCGSDEPLGEAVIMHRAKMQFAQLTNEGLRQMANPELRTVEGMRHHLEAIGPLDFNDASIITILRYWRTK